MNVTSFGASADVAAREWKRCVTRSDRPGSRLAARAIRYPLQVNEEFLHLPGRILRMM